jgi:hypothetical protein
MSKVLLKKVKVTWVTLNEAQGYQDNTDNRKWSVTLLIDKKDKDNVDIVKALIKDTIEAKKEWKVAQKKQVLKVAMNTDPFNKYCIVKDGDKLNARRKEEDKDWYNSYKGNYVVKVGRKETNGRMVIVDASNNRIAAEKIGEVANGNICNIQMSAYCYGKGGDLGITTQLEAVQKVTDDRFEAENPFVPIEGAEISSDDDNPFGDDE